MPAAARPDRTSDLQAALEEQARVWEQRPLLRRIYTDWYRAIADRLAPVAGTSIELGAGIGRFRGVVGDRVLLTDVEKTRWVDAQIDAMSLPYEDSSLANIVMLDVFHHLADPGHFLDEASRTLTPAGRVIMVEPYCSLISTPLYKWVHRERTDLHAAPFDPDPTTATGPMESNQARPTLVFFRHRVDFERRWRDLRLVEERRFSFLLYPLSGGFSRRPLVPSAMYGPISMVERALSPLGRLLAFRCLVVLEKRNTPLRGGQA